MTPQTRIRRMGWIVLLAILGGLYLTLHLKVQSVNSAVVRSERQIVALEQRKLLLETEFETRASQLQLAAWNRVDFGYSAPNAAQFLGSERQLAAFSVPPAIGAPSPIRLASAAADEGAPSFAALVQAPQARQVSATVVLAANDAASGEQAAATNARVQLAALAGGATGVGIKAE